jgi:hypothetical protein
LFRVFFPAAQAKPDQRADGGNECSPDEFQVSVSKQIPGNNPKKNAESFGDRESRAGNCD